MPTDQQGQNQALLAAAASAGASPLTVLDCTLRDGGYYNNWDFPTPLVRRYLEVMKEAGVDYVELGLRALSSSAYEGPYAFTVDNWLRHVGIPEGMRVGVMCNAKDLLRGGDPQAMVHRLFSPADESPVELVRVAAHFSEIEDSHEAVIALSELGYKVGFNFMQSSGRTREELTTKSALVASWPLDVLYFADSLGNMSPEDIRFTAEAMREGWPGPLGFHAHDNMGLALVNVLAAIDAGVTWIDATVLGMGRGAGNVRLEYLLLELAQRGLYSGKLDGLLNLVVEEFQPMQKAFGWGANLYYHLSAMYGVHPTYVQEMLSDERYKPSAIITALRRLGESGARGFSRDRLLDAMQDECLVSEGTWSAAGWLDGKDVLLIGPGEGVKQHLEGLQHYVEQHKPFVMCVNSNPWFPARLVDAWVACNRQRLLLDREFYAEHHGQLVVPAGVLDEESLAVWQHWTLLDFGIQIKPDHFAVHPNGAELPAALSAVYGLALCNAGGARRVLMAGFDGYLHGDPRHNQMEQALALYKAAKQSIPLLAITPTTLSLPETSPYAPEV